MPTSTHVPALRAHFSQDNATLRKYHGSTQGMAELYDVVTALTVKFTETAMADQPNDARVNKSTELTRDFLYQFMSYASWANPTSWAVDNVADDGAFGIIAHGPYTFLICLRKDGSITCHS